MLNWNESHDRAAMHQLVADGYIFCTSGPGLHALLASYGLPPDRCCVISHDEDDWANLSRAFGSTLDATLRAVRGFAVPSPHLVSGVLGRGMTRIPQVVPYGLTVSDWTFRARTRIDTIGMCGAIARQSNTGHADCKRGRLVLKVGQQVGRQVRTTEGKVTDVDDWYQSVGLNMTAGVFEGGPLSPYEAAACGIPTFGSHVGSWAKLAYQGAGKLLPVNDRDYIQEAVRWIGYYDANPRAYEELSHHVRATVLQYDWQYIVPLWQDFFEHPAHDTL